VSAPKPVAAEESEDDKAIKGKSFASSVDGLHIDTDDARDTGIPEFWLTALRNHVGLSEQITDKDEQALAHLIDVR